MPKTQQFWYVIVASILLITCKKKTVDDLAQLPTEDPFVHQVTFNYEYDITGLNDTIDENQFIVDVVLFHSDNISMTWNQLKAEFLTADDAFRAEGVQLKLKKAVNVNFPDAWNNKIIEGKITIPDSGQTLGFYEQFSVQKPVLNDTLKTAFTHFVYDEENKSRTLFILPIKGLKIMACEKQANQSWKIVGPFSTSAISFPGYYLEDRIPKNLRGVISMEQSSSDRTTLAHEIGHKLINVSHEGLNVSPAFSGVSIPGLMGYGGSTIIYGGQSGRWHKERLLKSPFLYKIVNGEHVYNPDYTEKGQYNDPIYGNLVMPD